LLAFRVERVAEDLIKNSNYTQVKGEDSAKSVKTIWLIKNLLSRLKCFSLHYNLTIIRTWISHGDDGVESVHVGNIFKQTSYVRLRTWDAGKCLCSMWGCLFACFMCLKCFSLLLLRDVSSWLCCVLMKTSVIMILIYCFLLSDSHKSKSKTKAHWKFMHKFVWNCCSYWWRFICQTIYCSLLSVSLFYE
jgi:hypothetical protein